MKFPVIAMLACTAGLLLTPGASTRAGMTTPEILAGTASALPSCSSYTVTGVCSFLRCGWTGCSIRTSIRIRHYVPDVVVSTYNDNRAHPWTDIGSIVARGSSAAGSAVLAKATDSAGSSVPNQESLKFKDADAIGNPLGRFAHVLSGGSMDPGQNLTLPNGRELARFGSDELPRITREWAQVPADAVRGVSQAARDLAAAPGKLMGAVQQASRLTEFSGKAVNIGKAASSLGGNIPGLEPLAALARTASVLSGGDSGAGLFCPGASSNFGVHFQSELDALFWRGILPLESLYTSSWIPGRNEVSQSASSTWGGRYPRTGELTQTNPVKASAVLAERVRSIITQRAQPHIYAPLEAADNGFLYRARADAWKWQMLYPRTESGCVTFGGNDSLGLTSFGDGKTSGEEGYMWNLWQRYECCQRRGIYLFSIP